MRAFIADDQVWLRSALRLLLEDEANIEVVGEAASLRSLAALVPQVHPDLLFLDWQLPGLETNVARQRLTASLRAMEPNLKIIALTGDEKIQYGLGADAYVNRSEPPDRIIATVCQTMGKRYQSSPPIASQHHLV
jgi:DNA-binding NarL/FixJ family response regulator